MTPVTALHVYEDSLDAKLVVLQKSFGGAHALEWSLFAIPSGDIRYEFHIPKNGVGTF